MPARLFEQLAALPLTVEGYSLEPLEYRPPGDGFDRLSTVVHLVGGGQEGVGEDVTYEALDQIAFRDSGTDLDLAGTFTLADFSNRLGELELFPVDPTSEVSRSFRRWAFESAALDLALRQDEASLHGLLGIEPSPVNFVVSMRLPRGEGDGPPGIDAVTDRLAAHPGLRFKLDPTNDWGDDLIAGLAATGAVDSLDLKGYYSGTWVDIETDPDLYSRLIEAFPEVWLEDPDVTPETRPLLDPVADRITWDAPIHSVADIEDAPWKPRMVNIKPSRFGTLEALMDAYDYCREQGIGAYGGGQWEIGPGRGQIQYLASLFHPDTPNDTAPSGYNTDPLNPDLPASPLTPTPSATGFRWEA